MKRILFLIMLVAVQALGDESALPDFSKYPHSDGFDYVIKAHRTGAFMERGVIIGQGQRSQAAAASLEPLLLTMTRFCRDSGNVFLQYFVTVTGYSSQCRHVIYGDSVSGGRVKGAVRASQSAQLAPDQLSILKEAVRKLPTSSTPPPLSQLVICSYREGDIWVTRALRPEDVKAIHAVIGELSLGR